MVRLILATAVHELQSFQLEKLQLKDILMVVDFCVCVEIDAFGPKIFESRNQK